MKIPGLVALVCAGTAFGQGFGQLASNLDGSALYFSAPLRLKGSSEFLHPKIFISDNNGIRLYEQRPSDVPFPLAPGDIFSFLGTEFFSLTNPDVSSDGSTVAVTGLRVCYLGDICALQFDNYQTTVYAAGSPAVDVPGSGVLSRNGRYVLLRSSILPILPNSTTPLSVLDLQTGQQTAYTTTVFSAPGGTHQVADDGTAVYLASGGFAMGQAGQTTTVPYREYPVTL